MLLMTKTIIYHEAECQVPWKGMSGSVHPGDSPLR
jgi:hypothetical protein